MLRELKEAEPGLLKNQAHDLPFEQTEHHSLRATGFMVPVFLPVDVAIARPTRISAAFGPSTDSHALPNVHMTAEYSTSCRLPRASGTAARRVQRARREPRVSPRRRGSHGQAADGLQATILIHI